MKRAAITAIVFAAFLPLRAAIIDVTASSLVTLNSSDSLLIYFRAPLDFNNPGQFAIVLGGMPIDAPKETIPGTSNVHVPGILFAGILESIDGSVAAPLLDPDAARLGLPAGVMVLQTGSRSGGSYSGPISVLSASAALHSAEGWALFSSGTAVLQLRNLGPEMTFGYTGSTFTSAFSASLINSDGTVSRGVMPLRVMLQQTPEPGTKALCAAVAVLLCLARRPASLPFRS